ncbi:MAG: LptA/OstA family protein [Alphaproteobacteria bacterium]
MRSSLKISFLSILFIGLGLFSNDSFARENKGSSKIATSSDEVKVNIKSQNLDFFPDKNYAIFSGGVVLQYGETDLSSELMQVYFDAVKGGFSKNATSSGSSSTPKSEISRVEFTKPVKIVTVDKVATANSGVYDVPTNNITLNDNVILKENGSIAKGEKLVFNTETNVAKFIGSSSTGGRVSGKLSNDKN